MACMRPAWSASSPHSQRDAGETVAVKVENRRSIRRYARIPAEMWTELETEFGVKFGRSKDCGGDTLESVDEPASTSRRRAGQVVLAVSGRHCVFLQYERSEPECERAEVGRDDDTVVGKRLDTEALRAADGELLLWTTTAPDRRDGKAPSDRACDEPRPSQGRQSLG